MKIIEKIVYEFNGKEYDSLEEAKEAQEIRESDISDFLRNNRKYMPNQKGIWVIKDEGPVDYGSNGGRRVLGYVEGSFENAVKYAFSLSGFVGYGPGIVEEIRTVKV